MTQSRLITGACEGVGLEIARLAAQSGAAVLMVAREAEKLQAAAATLSGAVHPEIAAVNLSDAAALDAFLASLDQRGYVPDARIAALEAELAVLKDQAKAAGR